MEMELQIQPEPKELGKSSYFPPKYNSRLWNVVLP